ncbi:hypothetical protein RBG61_02045 [Paludicola sp. MB14-C6]|uniref:hypothetical protein n=1 Tax=Paludihabitans sp. MB14-C6 TaxID=3070656 RepID=UPI0027DDE36F|nr:hypothetical protein [Paludicola sp. MB14-C6]WMJ23473.1 hypothetical protein RBG61_02045 [Paludicola sp. MB14-C6]
MIEVLLSIHKGHCRNILSGAKLIEIRKSYPKKDELSYYKCYLYETKADGGAGAIVGECFINGVTPIHSNFPLPYKEWIANKACIGLDYLIDYQKDSTVYAWNVSRVKQYNNPKLLEEFGLHKAPQSWCYIKKDQSLS